MEKFVSEKDYDAKYFEKRQFNDPKRLKTFDLEKTFLLNFTNLKGRVCDVGCSTGEFLEHICWEGERYGMEISDFAVEKAKETGISFDKNILNSQDFFDIIIFRGTIQHLPDPFYYIQKSFESLKSNGFIVFLSTPNTNSLVYKIFNDFHFLNKKLNFYVPSDIQLINLCNNYGFELIETEYPYFNSPYSNFIFDYFKFIISVFSMKQLKFSFHRNMMNLAFKKQ